MPREAAEVIALSEVRSGREGRPGDEAAAAAALRSLRAGYWRDVAALARSLRAQLIAGDFTGCDGGWLTKSHWCPDLLLRFDKLAAICAKHWCTVPAMARFTIALASREARAVCCESGPDSDDARMASFVLAWDVRNYAIVRWGAPDDDVFRLAEEHARVRRRRRVTRRRTRST
jgi:hypothetical protein